MSTSDAGDSAKTCFVAMPITTPTAYAEKLGDPEHFVHVLDHLFMPALQAAGLTVIPPSVGGSEMIHAEIIRNLEQADYVICDLSGLNPNVLFELGIRTSLDRPVILVRDDLTEKIPFDLNAINMIAYNSSLTPWSLASEIPRLVSHVKAVIDSGNPGNAMWRYFGLTKRGVPSEAGPNSLEAKVDLIIDELAQREQLSVMRTSASTSDLTTRRLVKSIESVLRGFGIHKFGTTQRESSDGTRSLEILLPFPDELGSSGQASVEQTLREMGFNDVAIIWGHLPSLY